MTSESTAIYFIIQNSPLPRGGSAELQKFVPQTTYFVKNADFETRISSSHGGGSHMAGTTDVAVVRAAPAASALLSQYSGVE